MGYNWVWPATVTRISGYNYGGSHHGIDIGVPTGGKILAPTEGKVKFAGWSDAGYGNLIIIKAKTGELIYLAHLSKLKVREGEMVTPAEVVGLGGSTGNSTGPHLHFEVRTSSGTGYINPWEIYGTDPGAGVPGYTPPGGYDNTPPTTDPVRGTFPPNTPRQGEPLPGAGVPIIGDLIAWIDGLIMSVPWDSVAFSFLGMLILLIGVAILASSEGTTAAGKIIGQAIKEVVPLSGAVDAVKEAQ